WLWAVTFHFTQVIERLVNNKPVTAWQLAALVFSSLLLIAAYVLVAARLPDLAIRARWFPCRVLGGLSLVGAGAIWLGASMSYSETLQVSGAETALTMVQFASAAVGGLAILLLPTPAKSTGPLFVSNRSHAANALAHRCLI